MTINQIEDILTKFLQSAIPDLYIYIDAIRKQEVPDGIAPVTDCYVGNCIYVNVLISTTYMKFYQRKFTKFDLYKYKCLIIDNINDTKSGQTEE